MFGTQCSKVFCFFFLKKKTSSFFEKKEAKKLLSLCLTVGLAGCGFRPLYGDNSDVAAQLAGIDVGLIPNRTGQVLREELQRRMLGADAGPVQYDLSVKLTLRTDIAGIIATNSVASRERLSATGSWTLRNVGDQKVVANGTANAADAENILNQQYFVADMETDAVNQRLMELLADQITAEVAARLRTAKASE
jgi:LPS-assembly lipoprotein